MTILATAVLLLVTPCGDAATEAPSGLPHVRALTDSRPAEPNDESDQRNDSAEDPSVTIPPPVADDSVGPDQQPAPILLEFLIEGGWMHVDRLTVRWDGSAQLHESAPRRGRIARYGHNLA